MSTATTRLDIEALRKEAPSRKRESAMILMEQGVVEVRSGVVVVRSVKLDRATMLRRVTIHQGATVHRFSSRVSRVMDLYGGCFFSMSSGEALYLVQGDRIEVRRFPAFARVAISAEVTPDAVIRGWCS